MAGWVLEGVGLVLEGVFLGWVGAGGFFSVLAVWLAGCSREFVGLGGCWREFFVLAVWLGVCSRGFVCLCGCLD